MASTKTRPGEARPHITSRSGRPRAHPELCPAASGSSPCLLQLHHHPRNGRDAVPFRQMQAAHSTASAARAHLISPLRGGIPCMASSLCRDPCSHFTSHHRCGPPIGSPLGPGRLIRLSGWPLAVIVGLELLGLLCSVMKIERKLSLFAEYLLSPPADRAEIRPRAVGPYARPL